jgi:hypothetical protein
MAGNKFDNIAKSLAEQEALQNKVNNSAAEYIKTIKEIGLLEQNLTKLKKNQAEMDADAVKAAEDKTKAQEEYNEAVESGNDEQISAAKKKLAAAKKEEKSAASIASYNQKQTKQLSQQLAQQKQIVKQANLANMAYKKAGDIWNNLPGLAQKFYGTIKNLAAVQMSKDIKQAELSMGVLGGQAKFFSGTISKASESTIQLGVGVSDLAKGAAGYSDELGRSVMLSEAGYQAMAEMARGTTLGMQGAAQMAGDMDRFGLSAEMSRDAIQETVDIAHSMGVNAEKAIKGLGKNLKIANTFHFKGGVKGMAEMAIYAEKMKVDIGSVAGMAGKVFRPEGAVEMAAQLQTMGGSFARLGNPFELMFKARNDFGAFTKEVAGAAAELAQFNSESGEFEISGLQLDRMRELAKITGINEEQLSEMAKAGAKFNKIESMVPSTFNEEDRQLISSIATMGKDGEFKVRMDGKELGVDELSKTMLDTYKNEKESLADRAKQAQTFDDAFNNLVNQFQSVLLPFVEALNTALVEPIAGLQEVLKDENVLANIKSLAEDVGGLIGSIGKFIIENPVTSLVTALGGSVFFNAAKWYAQGVQLGMGFNTVASAGGGGGMMDMLGKNSKLGKMGRLHKLAKGMPKGAKALSAVKGMAAKSGGKLMGRLGAPIAALTAGVSEYNEQKEKGKSTGAAVGRGALKGAGAGVGALAGAKGGAMAGAAIGALFGGVGAVPGAFIGGLIGSVGGALAGGKLADLDTYGVDDAIIRFNPNDKIVQMNDGLVASTDKGKIDDLVGGGGTKKVKVGFDKLDISGKIELNMPGGGTSDINLATEPEFIRQITNMIQEQLRTNLAGGKLTPQPIQNN